MPRVIEIPGSETCSLEDAVEGIAALEFNPSCEERLAKTAAWLRKLNNNRHFLGDLMIERIKPQSRETDIESGYGPQAILLSPNRGDVFLRANVWPSPQDHCFQASGAESFVYGVPHDHNFSFLTSGYLGPGYRSDYYEYDYRAVAGYPGERAGLRFIERSALAEAKIQLYRAHVDIHSQIPPESLSVSLNVMHADPAQLWFDQYGFDLEQGTITRVLSPNSTEAFLRVAVATRHAGALDLAEQFGCYHPSERLRLASFEARAELSEDADQRDLLWREAELSGSRMLATIARRKRAELAG
ncbi:transposase [Altererythrobacter arenosus]|uniref:Transposase n=1 Tax=Altererythrobacter arenosus TaxID=3032592 RepID=A0ABY8FS62_9SPHN|nr:transposase [Altererythrobacter sp. CAU 1644]WFL77602.1 transposase [Altererythrobacter sp. CAU 1644]